jgi:CheY-like chemotaxis protein
MQSLGTLAGGVAHYFNNVLAATMANVELMRDMIPVVDPLRENLDMITAASVRGSELVKQVLSFSRQKPGSRAVIRLDQVVVEVVQLLRVTIPAGIQIIMRLSAGAPCVLADSTQIHQVLLNLVTNAWHAIEGPVGRITIGLETCVVKAQHDSGLAMLPGSYAQISVTDDGRGMSEATLVRIFDPFFTTKNIGEGTGLGLAEVHGIVADHGGVVDVKSTLGRGSSFTIYLPGTGQPLVVVAPETREVQSGSGRILLLDDEASLVRIGKVLLERLGYKVAGFVEPEAALAAFRSAPGEFDIIVTDQNMPRISGLEVARAMRKLRPELPIVLVSGNGLLIGSEDSIADPLYRLGKPYTRGALSAILRKALCRD